MAKWLTLLILFLACATPTIAGDGADRQTLSVAGGDVQPAVTTMIFSMLPEGQALAIADGVSLIDSELRVINQKLRPIGTRPLFEQLGIRLKSHGLPSVVALKQLNSQAEFDWELAVAHDLSAAAVAINYRF